MVNNFENNVSNQSQSTPNEKIRKMFKGYDVKYSLKKLASMLKACEKMESEQASGDTQKPLQTQEQHKPMVYSKGLQYEARGVTCEITGIGECTDRILRIPPIIDGKVVNAVGGAAFRQCTSICEVELPDCVRTIAAAAFSECTNLTKVSIGNGVIEIGRRAFSKCTRLTDVYFGSNVATIQSEAFSCCGMLTTVEVSGDNKTFFSQSNCVIKTEGNELVVGNKTGSIPRCVTKIGQDAFREYDGLCHVLIPASVEEIGCGAFFGCKNLATVNMEHGVTKIGKSAFACCSRLREVLIPGSVSAIDEETFLDCCNLQKAELQDGIVSVLSNAFKGCSGLTKIKLPKGMTTIKYYAFLNCANLVEVVLPDSVSSLDFDSFAGCKKLNYNVYDNAYYLGTEQNPYFYLIKAKDEQIKNCSVHRDTKVILQKAFLGCAKLKEIVIPNSVVDLQSDAFRNCSSLKIAIIGSGVTKMEQGVFSNCDKLKVVTIGNHVTSIDMRAFEGCSKFTKIMIPASVNKIVGLSLYRKLKKVYFEDTENWSYVTYESITDARVHKPSQAAKLLNELYFGYSLEKNLSEDKRLQWERAHLERMKKQ